MSRPLRIEFDGAWYHVFNRGQNKQRIVRSDNDRITFFEVLGETSEVYQIELHAFSLMDNHYHLLIHTPKIGLSRAMRHLNGVYTQKINKAWKTDGPLFKGRYKAKLVDDKGYLIELLRYIHMNPVEGKITKKPEEHKWTSHRCYLDTAVCPEWLHTDRLLKEFGGNKKVSKKNCDDFVKQGTPVWLSKALQRNLIIIGTEGYKEWVYHHFVNKEKNGIPLKDKERITKVPVKFIIEHVGFAYDEPIAQIRKSSPGKKNEARSMAIYLTRQLAGLSHKEIANWFHISTNNTVGKLIERYKIKLTKDKKLNKLTKQIKTSILSHVKP
ncbi:MAG: transposase [bacterium]